MSWSRPFASRWYERSVGALCAVRMMCLAWDNPTGECWLPRHILFLHVRPLKTSGWIVCYRVLPPLKTKETFLVSVQLNKPSLDPLMLLNHLKKSHLVPSFFMTIYCRKIFLFNILLLFSRFKIKKNVKTLQKKEIFFFGIWLKLCKRKKESPPDDKKNRCKFQNNYNIKNR